MSVFDPPDEAPTQRIVNEDPIVAGGFARDELRRSLDNPHPESAELAEQGLEEWTRGLPEEDAAALVDPAGYKEFVNDKQRAFRSELEKQRAAAAKSDAK